MTRALRRRHRRVVLFLVVVLPIVFLAALLARRTVPLNGVPISKSMSTDIIHRIGLATGAPKPNP